MEGGQILGRRIAAALIDAAIVLILLVVVAKTLGEGDSSRSIWAETEGSARGIFFLLAFAYFLGTELLWSQTIGKRAMKLRVVRDDGSKLTPGPAVIRNLVRIVDWLPGLYIVGAITVFATGERRLRLGDLAAKTKVVPDDAAPPPPPPERPDDDDILAQVLR